MALLWAAPAVLAGPVRDQLPYANFIHSVRAARAVDYLARPGVKVEGASAFEEMRMYLENYYAGVTPLHSFTLPDRVIDCVPVMQQPGLRLQHSHGIAAPPPEDTEAGDSSPDAIETSPNGKGVGRDALGHVEQCSAGAIPVRRMTLDEMVKFRTLREFFRKAPDSDTHEYAIATEVVDNWGGNAALNLWKTSVNTDLGEDFSLSQHWYTSGSGSQTQTAETGWINYPGKFGNDPALFIYWTADGYNNTGCYNLECSAFVQTNIDWCLGCGFAHYSKTQGPQYEIELGFYFYQGNWWLKAGKHFWNTHESEWVGYYPASIYNGGQMSRNAQDIEYGGEVAVHSTNWPCMGSCHYADDGFRSAAYDRRIVYRGDTSNRRYTPSLSPFVSNPQCYTITTPTDKGDKWETYFYFGGPGGTSC